MPCRLPTLASWLLGLCVGTVAYGQAPDASIVDAINKSLRQEVERTAKTVESQKPATPQKPVQLLPADWMSQISQGYTITRDANQPLPLARLTWYLNHKHLLLQQLTQTRAIIFGLTQRLKAQGLPTELALVPLLTQGASLALSAPALASLKRLQPTLKDPLLLIAVYASSESAVLALQKAHPGASFWQLPWPARTATYVANLVALAQLLQHADYYGLTGASSPQAVPPALLPTKFQPLPDEVAPTLPDVMQRVFPTH